jgi:DNA-binding CsgD family transcriptional regulator
LKGQAPPPRPFQRAAIRQAYIFWAHSGKKWAMSSLSVLYFFAVAAIGGLMVRKSYNLQSTYGLPYLPSYTFFLASWSALVLFLIFQYILAVRFLPDSSWSPLTQATSPLFITLMAVSLYFFSAFLAQLSGAPLTKFYKIVFVVIWVGLAAGIALMNWRPNDSEAASTRIMSLLYFLLKSASVYGWILIAMLRLRKEEDLSKRRSLRIFIMLFLAGLLLFDLAVRIPYPAGLSRFDDYVIAACQILAPCPSLIYLGHFLRRHALDRPFREPRLDLKTVLAPFGISVRETEIVELIMKGLSNKEIADRLCISVDTVKKHSYNSYKKLNVQNRVQLSYFIQNLPVNNP